MQTFTAPFQATLYFDSITSTISCTPVASCCYNDSFDIYCPNSWRHTTKSALLISKNVHKHIFVFSIQRVISNIWPKSLSNFGQYLLKTLVTAANTWRLLSLPCLTTKSYCLLFACAYEIDIGNIFVLINNTALTIKDKFHERKAQTHNKQPKEEKIANK